MLGGPADNICRGPALPSAAVVPRCRQRRRRCGWREQAFLELMSQLFRDLDFGTGSEARHRIRVGAMIVQFNLEHIGLLRLGEMTSKTRRPGTCMPRASDGMSCKNKLRGPVCSIYRLLWSTPCKHSRHLGRGVGLRHCARQMGPLERQIDLAAPPPWCWRSIALECPLLVPPKGREGSKAMRDRTSTPRPMHLCWTGNGRGASLRPLTDGARPIVARRNPYLGLAAKAGEPNPLFPSPSAM